MMRKALGLCVAVICLGKGVSAQLPDYYEPLAVYREANELLDKAKYGAAQEKYEVFLDLTRNTVLPRKQNDMIAEARFERAFCAYNLLRNNAGALFEEYVSHHPGHSRVNEAWFYVGKLWFIKKEFPWALEALDKAEALPAELRPEAGCMRGYCLYKGGKTNEALAEFNSVRRGKGEWAQKASYYYALLNYQSGNYAQAWEGFQAVTGNSGFQEDLPVYKATCLLKLEKYEELDAYGQSLLTGDKKAPADVYLALAHSSFERQLYSRAKEYFTQYEARGGKADRGTQYRIGYTAFKLGEYAAAEERLQKTVRPEDSLAQNAWYYLGFCNLHNQKPDNARTAFRQAAELSFNPRIGEEALFQYGKVSFAEQYMEDALVAFQRFVREYPSSPYKEDANGMIGEILLYSSNYKEAIDYFETNGGMRNERAQKAYQRAAYQYAMSLFEKQVYEEANTYFKKAYNQRQDADLTLASYFWYAEGLFRMEQYEKSVEAWNAYLKQPQVQKHTQYAYGWYGLAWSYFKLKNQEEFAYAHFEKFLALAPKDVDPALYVDALLRAGDCQFKLKNYARALDSYVQVRDYNSRFVDYALYQIGQVQFRRKEYQKAANSYSELANGYKKSEYRDDALYNAADLYYTWLSDWANCARYARLVVDEHPNSPHVPQSYLLLGFAEKQSGQKEKATNYFKKIVFEYCASRDEVTSALAQLNILLSNADFDQVQNQYRNQCPYAQENAGSGDLEKLDYNVAVKRYFDQDYASALEKFNQFLTTYPQSTYAQEITFYRGLIHEKNGNLDQAQLDYEAVYNSGQPGSFVVKALKQASDLQFRKGNYLIASELYTALEQKADRLEDRMNSRFGKAKCFMAMENWQRAREEVEIVYADANATAYSKVRARLLAAQCMYHMGQLNEAYTAFSDVEKSAQVSKPFAAEAQYWITRVLYDQKRYEDSKNAAKYAKNTYGADNGHWVGMAYLVMAEDYIAQGDTFQAVYGTLKSLSALEKFPEIQELARKRLDELKALGWDVNNPDGPGSAPVPGNGKKEENER